MTVTPYVSGYRTGLYGIGLVSYCYGNGWSQAEYEMGWADGSADREEQEYEPGAYAKDVFGVDDWLNAWDVLPRGILLGWNALQEDFSQTIIDPCLMRQRVIYVEGQGNWHWIRTGENYVISSPCFPQYLLL